MKTARLLLLLAPMLAPAPVHAAFPRRVAAVSLPGSVRPASLAAADDGRLFLVGTNRRPRYDELYAIDVGPDGRSATVAWSLEIGAKVSSIAVEGARAYLATSDDAAELVIVDLALRSRIGAFDAAGRADGKLVEVVAPGVVRLGRRRSGGPEFYRLDVAEPSSVAVLEEVEDRRGVRPEKVPQLDRYRTRGKLVGRVDREVPAGPIFYLATTDREAHFQVVLQPAPASFRDVDGDGVYRLGCVGDSNTSLPTPSTRKWCEIVRDALWGPDFEVVNVAVAGATVNPNLRFDSDATMQMEEVLAHRPDAVVLSFGTNDVFQGRSAEQIRDAYLQQQATADAAGIAFLVASTPPIGDCSGGCPKIEQANALLEAAFAGRTIDFYRGFTLEHFKADGYHANDAGQALRAERALEVLENPFD